MRVGRRETRAALLGERDWAGRTRPSAQWLRLTGLFMRLGARRRGGFDTERASNLHDESRIHDGALRLTLIADHVRGPALDERLVRAVGSGLTVRVVRSDVAGLDNHDHDARMEVPARGAMRLEGERLHLDVRRNLGLALNPILVHPDAVGERRPVA